MKFGVVIKSTTVNRFVLHTLQRNITHLAVITRKTNIKLCFLKGGGGGTGKEPKTRSIDNFFDFKSCSQKKKSFTFFMKFASLLFDRTKNDPCTNIQPLS